MIRKFYGIIFIATLLFTSGCKQDEAVIPSTLQNPALLGKWYLKQVLDITDPAAIPDNDFTANDYFEFKTGNVGTYSSVDFGQVFEGYYSINSTLNPQTLSFKSGTLLLKYTVDELSLTDLILIETVEQTINGTKTIILYQHNYSRIP